VSGLKTCPQCGSEYGSDIKFCPKDGSTLRLPAGANLVGSVIADRYHILRKLGEGGMGQVYLAEHVKMGRKSAIKVMNPTVSGDPDAIGRFNREAANASRISHPNVAAIYDFGETVDGLIYLAMEFVEGEPLTALLGRVGPLPPSRAANIARQVAEALDAAHELGIVHRDLKPDNIMVARHRDGSDLVKVVDFGIAKAQHGEGQNVTRTGLVVGTPEYMSPEQLSGDHVDGRSDVYALGLVVFHMLTGTLPFPSSTIQESMIMRLTDRPRTLSEMRPEVAWPAALQRVLDRALARTVDERYPRASELAADLLRTVRGLTPAGGAQEEQSTARTRLLESSVPATRVRATGDGGEAAGPVPQGRRRRRLLVPLGVGAGLVAVAVGAWLLGSEQRPAIALSPSDSARRPSAPLAASAAGAHPSDSVSPPSRSASQERSTEAESRPRDGGVASSHEPPRRVLRGRGLEPLARRAGPGDRLADVAAESSRDTGVRVTGTTGPSQALVWPGGAERAERGVGAGAEPTLTVERARAAVALAGTLLVQSPPQTERAMHLLGQALKYLPTRDDSVTAFYHVSEGLFQRAERTGNPTARRRACEILRHLRAVRSHPYASAIRAMYDQQCT
jgi:serine/threonine protein kinase